MRVGKVFVFLSTATIVIFSVLGCSLLRPQKHLPLLPRNHPSSRYPWTKLKMEPIQERQNPMIMAGGVKWK